MNEEDILGRLQFLDIEAGLLTERFGESIGILVYAFLYPECPPTEADEIAREELLLRAVSEIVEKENLDLETDKVVAYAKSRMAENLAWAIRAKSLAAV
jgi:hypothetical protein